MNGRFDPIIEEVELLVAESARLAATGPHFVVLHEF
jgi:hypothetical protein